METIRDPHMCPRDKGECATSNREDLQRLAFGACCQTQHSFTIAGSLLQAFSAITSLNKYLRCIVSEGLDRVLEMKRSV